MTDRISERIEQIGRITVIGRELDVLATRMSDTPIFDSVVRARRASFDLITALIRSAIDMLDTKP